MLIPNACIKEIFRIDSRQNIKRSPNWCMGLMEYKGQQIHLISLENIEQAGNAPTEDVRLAVLLNKPERYALKPDVAFVASEIPHIVQADSHSLETEYSPQASHTLALSYVKIKEKQAFIPDLERLFRDYSALC